MAAAINPAVRTGHRPPPMSLDVRVRENCRLHQKDAQSPSANAIRGVEGDDASSSDPSSTSSARPGLANGHVAGRRIRPTDSDSVAPLLAAQSAVPKTRAAPGESELSPTDSNGPDGLAWSSLGPRARNDDYQEKLSTSRQIQKEAEKRTDVWMDCLMENQKCSMEDLKIASLYLQPGQYSEITHERHLISLCSYPACSNPPRRPFRSYSDHIPANPDVDAQMEGPSRKKYAVVNGTVQLLVGANHQDGFCSRGCEARSRWYAMRLDKEPVWCRRWWEQDGGMDLVPEQWSPRGRTLSNREKREEAARETVKKAADEIAKVAGTRSKVPTRVSSGQTENDPRSGHNPFRRYMVELLEELEGRGEILVDSRTGKITFSSAEMQAGPAKSDSSAQVATRSESNSERSLLAKPTHSPDSDHRGSHTDGSGTENSTQDDSPPQLRAEEAQDPNPPGSVVLSGQTAGKSEGSARRRAKTPALTSADLLSSEGGSTTPTALANVLSSLRIVERVPKQGSTAAPSLSTSKAMQDTLAARMSLKPTKTIPSSAPKTLSPQAREAARRRFNAGALGGEDDLLGARSERLTDSVVSASKKASASVQVGASPQPPGTLAHSSAQQEYDDEPDDQDGYDAFEQAMLARRQLEEGTFE